MRAPFPLRSFRRTPRPHTDNQCVFRGTRPTPEKEKRENKEITDDDGDAAKVELFSVEEGVSSRSSVAPRSAVSLEICPFR